MQEILTPGRKGAWIPRYIQNMKNLLKFNSKVSLLFYLRQSFGLGTFGKYLFVYHAMQRSGYKLLLIRYFLWLSHKNLRFNFSFFLVTEYSVKGEVIFHLHISRTMHIYKRFDVVYTKTNWILSKLLSKLWKIREFLLVVQKLSTTLCLVRMWIQRWKDQNQRNHASLTIF